MTAVKRRYRQFVTCWGCRKEKRHEGKGLCGVCRGRYDEETGRLRPPMPPEVSGRIGGLIGGPRATVRRVESRDQRLEDFAELASWGVGDEEAARRLGVSLVTIGRYKAALRAGVQLRIRSEFREAS